jgi:hypothetical protein
LSGEIHSGVQKERKEEKKEEEEVNREG